MIEGTFTGERLPGSDDAHFAVDMERHLAAYRCAAEYATGVRVLDAGCGEGYGACMLSEVAAEVVGVDRAEPIAVASERYRRANLAFRVADLTGLDTIGDRFDLVTSFQVIEHLEDPVGFLRALASVTAPGGTLIVTTPNRLMSVSENPYHVREWTAPELLSLARPVLPSAEVRGVRASERVLGYERARGEQVARILRLDPLGIRHLLPDVIVRGVFPRLAKLVRRRVAGGAALPTVDASDFTIARDDLERVLDLVLVATL